MSKLTKFVSSIPTGMKIYAHGVDVVVPNQRQRIARKFARRRKRRIYLRREPGDRNGSNAIRVIGKSRGWFLNSKQCIGYVPEDIARKLVTTGIEDKVIARLQLIDIEDRNSINIRFDLLGPLNEYHEYHSR
jgi:hypothetical protein